MTSSALPNQGQKYQGYPYVNPIAIDAPTIDAQTASRWTNLPRRQLVPEKRTTSNPVVYIDMPGNAASSDTTEEQREQRGPSTGIKPELDDTPAIYIDLPESVSQPNRPEVRDDERRDCRNETNQRDFVQETIFYDPFEDRRINIDRNQSSSQPGSSSTNTEPPISSSTQGFMSKETYIYGSQQPPQSSPPVVSERFPEPPPAYTEIAPPVNQGPYLGSTATGASPEPPRTEVIVTNPQYPIGIARSGRKLVSCQYCRLQVHTLAVRENGILTHVLACIFLIFFAPLSVFIYCTDYFKYVNHYCPNCNKLIGYEVPMLCQEMTYSKTVGG